MTVAELIEQLKQCNPEAKVCVDSFIVEEDYDWDENLSVDYVQCVMEADGVEEDNFEDEDRVVIWCFHQ